MPPDCSVRTGNLKFIEAVDGVPGNAMQWCNRNPAFAVFIIIQGSRPSVKGLQLFTLPDIGRTFLFEQNRL